MLSQANLKTFSRFIYINTRLYLIPSTWNPGTRQFKELERRPIIEYCLVVFDIIFRSWINFAYGYMTFTRLEVPSSTVKALMPIMYLCAVNWCAVIRFVSHSQRLAIEQFINNFYKMNDYLIHYLHINVKLLPRQRLLAIMMLSMDMTSVICTLVPAFIWSQNYLEVNAYIYFFGMNPGTYVYSAFTFIWIFWNWRTFVYFVTLNFLYLISTCLWLGHIL